jgi:hypothetical protein
MQNGCSPRICIISLLYDKRGKTGRNQSDAALVSFWLPWRVGGNFRVWQAFDRKDREAAEGAKKFIA